MFDKQGQVASVRSHFIDILKTYKNYPFTIR